MFLISEIFHLHCQADWWRSVDGLTNQATGKLLIKSLCLFGQNLIDKLVYLQFFILMVSNSLFTLFSFASYVLFSILALRKEFIAANALQRNKINPFFRNQQDTDRNIG